MSDDMLVHFSSNSSNQSDQSLPTKIAKLEARMVGKGSSSASQQQGWSSVSSAGKFSGAVEDLVEPCTSSDSDDVSFMHFYLQDGFGTFSFMQ
jgi:tousled-like kinase